MNESCWKGYKQIGMKKKGGRTVPNCVKKNKFSFAEWLNESNGKIYYHVTTRSNYKIIEKEGLLPKMGERSSKIESELKIFMFSNKDAMTDAVMNWLGDEFDEEEELVVLKISLPADFPVQHNGFEATTDKSIPPQYIQKTNIEV